jgi:WD repeat-containing protein 68
MAFSDGTNVFGSVGADGSLRIFDLRSLESSTIVYETQDLKPLLRIAWNKQDPRYIATIVSSSDRVVILDLRNAARPVFELSSHTGNINSISWSQQSRHHICSAAEDGKAIMWDLGHTPDGGSMEIPTLLYHSLTPINQIRWSPTEPSWLALCEEESLHVLQV